MTYLQITITNKRGYCCIRIGKQSKYCSIVKQIRMRQTTLLFGNYKTRIVGVQRQNFRKRLLLLRTNE